MNFKRSWKWRLSVAGAMAACAAAPIVSFGLTRGCSPVVAVPRPFRDVVPRETDGASSDVNPVAIAPVRAGLLQLPANELEECLGKIRPPVQVNVPSLYLHVLRLHGLEATFEHPQLDSGRAILELFTDADVSRSFFGAPHLVRTRNGVAYIGGGEDAQARMLSSEAHRDQCLAALAEFGVPLSQPLRLDGEQLELRDVLRDSVANFHLRQRELQWTALAYALYLPPEREWTNKFGEGFDFDDLVETLCNTSLHDSSCAGTHLVYTLTVLYRVDREHRPLLSDDVRERLRGHLHGFAAAAVTTQEQDGSWPLDWHRHLTKSSGEPAWSPDLSDPDGRLLVTGHLAEWLLYLPEEFDLPDDCLERAGLWLFSRLREVSDDAAVEQVCPHTHAACVLRLMQLHQRSGT